MAYSSLNSIRGTALGRVSHSFGGHIAEELLATGHLAAAVAIDPTNRHRIVS